MDACTGVKLTPQYRRGIRVFAQSLGVTASKDLHQPAIEVIHRMIHDRPESPIVLSVRLLNVIAQSQANVFVRAACLHLLGPSILMSCMQTLATRLARRCISCSSTDRLARSNAATRGSAAGAGRAASARVSATGAGGGSATPTADSGAAKMAAGIAGWVAISTGCAAAAGTRQGESAIGIGVEGGG